MTHLKLICFCILLLLFTNKGLGQGIPNGSFEETTFDSFGNIIPKQWSHQYLTILMSLQNGKSTDSAYEGERFLALGVLSHVQNNYDSSVCILKSKFKITSLPSELTAYYKYIQHPVGEKFLVTAKLFKHGTQDNVADTIATGFFEPTIEELNRKWKQLKFKIDYRKEEIPDSAEIIFYAAQRSSYTSQTILLIDNVKFSDSLRALSIGDKVVFQPANKVTVYPNPATNQLFVKINEFSNKNYTLKIYDLLGRELINKQFTGENNPEFEINTSLLATGVYVLDVKSEDRSIEVSHKITVAKP